MVRNIYRKVLQFVGGATTAALISLPASAAYIDFAGVNGSVLTSYTAASPYGPATTGAIFALGDTQGTGTGVFPAFLRIETDPKSDSVPGEEDGFNTDGALLNDEKSGHTSSVLMANLGTIGIAGIDYFEFRLDWNEPNNGFSKDQSLIIQQLQFYVSDTGNQTNADPQLGLGAGNVLFYDLLVDLSNEAGTPVGFHVFDTNAGQGQDDFQILLPVSLLTGIDTTGKYLTLYAKMGVSEPKTSPPTDVPGAAEPAFEEFSYRACPEGSTDCIPPPPQGNVPEPATYVLMGLGLAGLGLLKRRKA